MTIAGWATFILLTLVIIIGALVTFNCADKTNTKMFTVIISMLLICVIFFGMYWYFHNTGSGSRALTDQYSNLNNGIDRIINVYTANGELIAHYEGKIDIDTNDGGYIKFDFEGKRYIYYNAFVETIANIN